MTLLNDPLNKKPSGISEFSVKLKDAAELLANLAKSASILSVIIGGPMMWSYLSSAGAPFPAGDAALALLLLVYFLMLASVLTIISIGLMLPATVKFLAPPAVKEYFPGLFKDPGSVGDTIRGFWKDYFCLYSIMFLSLANFIGPLFDNTEKHQFFPDIPALSWVDRETLPWAILFLILSIYAAVDFCFCLFRNNGRHVGWMPVYGFRVGANFASLIWIVYFGSFMLGLAKSGLESSPKISKALEFYPEFVPFAIIIIVLLPHALLSRGAPSLRRIIAFLSFWVLIMTTFFPGAVSLTSTALRTLGFGGGVPVTMLIKRYAFNSKEARAERVSGCMILQTSTAIILRGEEHDDKNCVVRPRLMEPFTSSASYEGITVFQRSDVLEIGAFRPKLSPSPHTP